MTQESDDIEAVLELMRDPRFCMLTTREGSRLVSRPMTPQDVTESGDIWFFVSTQSDQARQIAADENVNVAFSDDSAWVSVAGQAELVDDRERIDELWNPMVSAWFPDGKDSADVALLHVNADTAEFWDTPGGLVASAKAFVSVRVKGERPEGNSGTVDLPDSE